MNSFKTPKQPPRPKADQWIQTGLTRWGADLKLKFRLQIWFFIRDMSVKHGKVSSD